MSRATRQRNWGRNLDFVPGAYHRPESLDELGQLVRRIAAQGQRLRAVGARHSWSPLWVTSEHLVSLEQLRDVRLVGDRRVQVDGGARIKDVNAFLATQGLAFANLGSISEQALAGAISTGTHGSGRRFGIMSTQVVELELLTASGELVTIGPAHELFGAARLSLGALGIVTKLTIECVPAFNLRETTRRLPFMQAFGSELVDYMGAHDYVQLYWQPNTDEALLFQRHPTLDPAEPAPTPSAIEAAVAHTMLGLGSRVPPLVPVINRLGRSVVYKEATRVGRSDAVLNVPLPPRYLEIEYALPMERAGRAMTELRAAVEAQKLKVAFPVILRFGQADEVWLSPAYQRDSCFISMLVPNARPEARRSHAVFERLMLEQGGRPHWGKLFSIGAAELERMYPVTYGRFGDAMRTLDPHGVFRNAFLERCWPQAT